MIHATPPLFGTQPLDDADDLFDLIKQTCADCGQSFQSSRHAARCALCASLRGGQVGAATVQCPACGIEHQIPIMKPHNLCLSCSADMEMTLAYARNRYDDAVSNANALSARLDADVAHADDATRTRFEAAVTMLATGRLGDRQLTTEQVRAAWDKALTKDDELSVLLALYDAAAAAALTQQRAAEVVSAIEKAMNP